MKEGVCDASCGLSEARGKRGKGKQDKRLTPRPRGGTNTPSPATWSRRDANKRGGQQKGVDQQPVRKGVEATSKQRVCVSDAAFLELAFHSEFEKRDGDHFKRVS